MCYSNSEVELEVKSEHPDKSGEICFVCNEKPVTKIVEIGEVACRYGAEWPLCSDEECRNKAMTQEVKNTLYAKTHRRKLSAEYEWNHREGK